MTDEAAPDATTAAERTAALQQDYDKAFPVGDLTAHPENPNNGDVEGISDSIEELGFFGACLVQRPTENHGHRILVGEHRWIGARRDGLDTVPVMLITCADDLARRIMLADNAWARRASYDKPRLADVLQAALDADDTGLDGTGFTPQSLDDLLEELRPPGLDTNDVGGGGAPSFTAGDGEEHRCPNCGYTWDE